MFNQSANRLIFMFLRVEFMCWLKPATQRDCRKIPGLKNVHKNLPQQAEKLSKCCTEEQKPDAFQRICPTFQK
jgi:hypothetical protein